MKGVYIQLCLSKLARAVLRNAFDFTTCKLQSKTKIQMPSIASSICQYSCSYIIFKI